jgi:cytochrome oxidase Cu insertion factor (SCO1/SenC/PrrC family)
MNNSLKFLIPKKGAIILFSILTGFSLLIIFLLSGSPVYVEQPVFGEFHDPFVFHDENNNVIKSEELSEKIVLYNFLSSECPTNFNKCPLRLEWFKIKIYDELVSNKGFKDVVIVSVFIDDISDVQDKMREFRTHNNLDSEKWIFATTDHHPFFDINLKQGNPWLKKDTLFGYEREAYLMTLLVDKKQRIRGKYFTYNFGEVRRITKEISLLLKEDDDQ